MNERNAEKNIGFQRIFHQNFHIQVDIIFHIRNDPSVDGLIIYIIKFAKSLNISLRKLLGNKKIFKIWMTKDKSLHNK